MKETGLPSGRCVVKEAAFFTPTNWLADGCTRSKTSHNTAIHMSFSLCGSRISTSYTGADWLPSVKHFRGFAWDSIGTLRLAPNASYTPTLLKSHKHLSQLCLGPGWWHLVGPPWQANASCTSAESTSAVSNGSRVNRHHILRIRSIKQQTTLCL